MENLGKKVISDLAPEIYEDSIKPGAKEFGGILATLAGLVNHVVLYKPKTWIAQYQMKFEHFCKEYKDRLNSIPDTNIGNPDIQVVGPLLESLKFSLDNDAVKEMYLNLLINSIDNRHSNIVHPMFVEIIKKMNHVDAVVFQYLYRKYNAKYICASNINIAINGTKKIYVNALPEWIIEDEIDEYSIKEISESLIRLSVFGIISILYDRNNDESENSLEKHYSKQEVQLALMKYKPINPNIELRGTMSIIFINELGVNFASVVFE